MKHSSLVTNFQDLVAKVKNLVALAPVLGTISHPGVVILFNLLNSLVNLDILLLYTPVKFWTRFFKAGFR